jgi:hypothetical protein
MSSYADMRVHLSFFVQHTNTSRTAHRSEYYLHSIKYQNSLICKKDVFNDTLEKHNEAWHSVTSDNALTTDKPENIRSCWIWMERVAIHYC